MGQWVAVVVSKGVLKGRVFNQVMCEITNKYGD